jgi:guanylate kinase
LEIREHMKIYYIMGKSASGKDTLFLKLLEEVKGLKKLVPYTTRPMRVGEEEGGEYKFIDEATMDAFRADDKVIEERTYDTERGPWTYATIDDGRINLDRHNYLAIGTLESYKKIKEFFGEDRVFPIYLVVDSGIRLQRALNRERMQEEPQYDEMCRRYLADEEDFSDEKVREVGIAKSYLNDDLVACLEEILKDMV